MMISDDPFYSTDVIWTNFLLSQILLKDARVIWRNSSLVSLLAFLCNLLLYVYLF